MIFCERFYAEKIGLIYMYKKQSVRLWGNLNLGSVPRIFLI